MRQSDFTDLAIHGVLTFGDTAFRGACPKEEIEQVTFFNRLRKQYPALGTIAIHPRNEGLRTGGHISSVAKHKAEGMTVGSSDVIIPARISFVCEIKRRDHTLSKWQDGQQPYLITAASMGAFACVALGCDAAWQALQVWIAANAL